MKRILIFFILSIGYAINFYGQAFFHEEYTVTGVYKKVTEDEAWDYYHFIEYDDQFYIKEKFEEGETHDISIRQQINSQFYLVIWEENGIYSYYYIMLQFPIHLWKGEIYSLKISEATYSTITKVPTPSYGT